MALNSLGLGMVFTARDLASGVMNRVRTTFSRTATTAEKNSRRMGAAFASIGLGVAGLTAGLVGISLGAAAANQFGQFGKTIAGVAAVSRATSAELKLLESSAISAGLATQFSPQEAAEGLQNLATAGYNARDATQALLPVLDLATGSLGQLGVAEAANAVVGTLNSYNQTAEDAVKVTDKLLRITQLTNFQARDFEAGLSKSAAAGGVFNQSLDDTLVVMGLLRNRNIDASASSTAVREAFRRLGADKLAQKALKEAGVSAFDANGKMKPVIETTLELVKATADMTEEQRNAIVVQAFGARGLLAFSAISKAQTSIMRDGAKVTLEGADAIAHLRSEIAKADGTSQEFRETLLATFQGQKDLLRGVLQTFGVVMGEGFAGVFKPFVSIFVQGLTAVTNALNEMPKGLRTALAALFLAGVTFLTAGSGITLFGATLFLLLPALKIIALTFLAVGAALSPLIALAGAGALAFFGFRQAFDRNMGGIGDKASRAFEQIKMGFSALAQLLSEGQISGPLARDLMKAENEGLLNFVIRLFGIATKIKNFFSGAGDGFSQWVDLAKPSIDGLMKALDELGGTLGFLSDNIDANLEGIKFDDAGRKGERFGFLIGKAFEAVVKGLTKIVKFTDWMIKNWEDIKTAAKWVGYLSGALVGLKFATYAAAAATRFSWLAQLAYNGAAAIGQMANMRLSASALLLAARERLLAVWTWAVRGAMIATGAVMRGLTAAKTLFASATGTATAAQNAFAGSSARSAIASGRARLAAFAAAGAMKGFAAMAGAAAAAVGGVMLAMDQASKLADETEGLGVSGTISQMWKRGTFDPFEAVNAYQDERAIERARHRKSNAGAKSPGEVAAAQPFVAAAEAQGAMHLPSPEEIMASLERGAAKQRPAPLNMNPVFMLDGEAISGAISGRYDQDFRPGNPSQD